MRFLLAALLAGTLLAAGCGGGSSSGGDGAGTAAAGNQASVLAYETGYQQCNDFSLEELQQTFSAEAATKESVAEAVARANPGLPGLQPAIKLGCTEALEGKPFEPSNGLTVATGTI